MFFWKHNRNPKYKKSITQPEDIEELGVPNGRKDLLFGKYLFSTVGIFIPCACFQLKRTIFFKWPEKAREDVRAFVKKITSVFQLVFVLALPLEAFLGRGISAGLP